MKPDLADRSKKISGDHIPLPKLPPIPCGRYTDEGFYQAEMKYVFRKSWLQVAHISEFDQAGSYRALDIPIAPVFIVRGKDGHLRAFLNACRHRGAKVVRENSGCAQRFTCPYHSWTYDINGQLIGLPAKESFADLILEDLPLKSVRCELWGGFVFINFDENAIPLLDWLEPMASRYTEIAGASLRIAHKQSFEVDCNWKLLSEAFCEIYHVPSIHSKTAAPGLDAYKTFFEVFRNGSTMYIPYSKKITELDWKGLTASASDMPMLPIIEGMNYKENVVAFVFFPNFTIPIQPLGFGLTTFWPLGSKRSRIDITWYGMDWGAAEKPEMWKKIVSDFEILLEEDFANLASIQESVEADPGKNFFLSGQEVLIYHLHENIDKAIGIEKIASELRVPDVGFLEEFITT